MRHNNCVAKKLSHNSTRTHQLRTCNALCIWMFVYVLGSWSSSQSLLTCSSNTTQTRLWKCLTVNSFPKSRLFAKINMFKLFDVPKSRLK